MAEQSAGFWESGKICACIGFGNMRKILSPKRLQIRGSTLLKWTNCTASSREKNRFYAITLLSRAAREIVGFDIAFDKSRKRIQRLVDRSVRARQCYSDAYSAHSEVCYEGALTSLKNKSQTYTVEGVISDLRHYIPPLRRRSKCFFRSLETANAVFKIFVSAFNLFARAKKNFPHLKSAFCLSSFI